MKNFSKSTFFLSTLIFVLLLIPSIIASFGEDEGTIETNIFWVTFAKLFHILRFPTHTLFWAIISKGGPIMGFGGLLINCMFYGFITERLISFFKIDRKK